MSILTVHPDHIAALFIPIFPDSVYQIIKPPAGPSKLKPDVKPPNWSQHMAAYMARILQFLIERNRRININRIHCWRTMANNDQTLNTFLHQGWDLFTENGHKELFGERDNASKEQPDEPFFSSIWSHFARTWRFILENDSAAPWRDNMVKTTLLKRGEFEIRFYLFQVCCVEYFSTVALSLATLTKEFNVNMPFGEQEYAAWCSLIAATQMLFSGKGREQLTILSESLAAVCVEVGGMKEDVTAMIRCLLEEESRMSCTLAQLPQSGVVDMYNNAYIGLAQRVDQVFRMLAPNEPEIVVSASK